MGQTIKGSDLLMLIKSISSERNIPFDEVLFIFSDSLAQSLRKNQPEYREADFRVQINPETGEAEAFRRWRVLEEEEIMENPEREMIVEEARERSGEENVNPGDIIEEPLPQFDFNQRTSMLLAKQHLNIHLRGAERRKLIDEMLSRNESLVSGQVLRILRNRGRRHRRSDARRLPPAEKRNDSAGAIESRRPNTGGGQGNRRGKARAADYPDPDLPELLVCLFERYVPEIEKGVLEIVATARSPGNRAKIAVRSNDPRVDPVGTCVGVRGSRVQQVTNELNGERIDIVHWDEDDAKYVLRALAPAEVSKISVDRERHLMDVLVERELMAQAIGRNGTNVRLASELTGWELNLKAPDEYEAETEETAAKKSAAIAEILDLELEAARVLYDEGFETLEHVAFVDSADLLEIEGFDEEIVESIQLRAREAVEKKESVMQEKLTQVEESLQKMEGMDDRLLYDLVNGDIMTLSDFADLSADELLELSEIPSQRATDLIMRARSLLEESEGEEEAAV